MKQGTPLRPSKTIEAQYRRELLILTRAMQKSVMRELDKAILAASVDGAAMDSKASQSTLKFSSAAFTSGVRSMRLKYDSIFQQMGKMAALQWIDRQIKYAATSFLASIRSMVETEESSFMLKGSVVNDGNRAFIEEKIKENVALIKSVGNNYFDRIEKKIMGSLTGTNPEQIREELKKIGGMSDRQADLIARDQSSKIYSQLTIENAKRAGITKVKWMHSGGGKHPREYHQRKWDGKSEPPNGLNGYIYDIDNPPVADLKTGERAIAGYLINCRCVNLPVIDY